MRYTDLHARSNAFRSQVTPTRAELEPYLKRVDADDFLSDIPGTFPRSFLSTAPTFDYVFDRAQAAEPNPDPNGKSTLLPNLQRDYDFSEKTLAAYLMVSGEGEIVGDPVQGQRRGAYCVDAPVGRFLRQRRDGQHAASTTRTATPTCFPARISPSTSATIS